MDVKTFSPEQQGAPSGANRSNNQRHKSRLGGKLNGVHHKGWFKLVTVVVVIVVVAIAGYAAWQYNQTNGQPKVNSSDYQAVFLTNGQVYFGKLSAVNKNYLNLTDIYYLQVQTAQPSSVATGTASKSAAATTNGSSKVQLVKLGSELHGPVDQMAISHQQVLFWENLKPNGKVTQAINQYQKK